MRHAAAYELGGWRRVLEQLSDFIRVASAAGDAIANGDAPRARVLVHETRAIRAALARAQSYAEGLPLPENDSGLELIAKMKVARQQSVVADQIARAWIERELPDDDTLRSIEGGFLAMADRLLPATWDVDVDVIALIGSDAGELAQALSIFGQRRIVIYAPEGETGAVPDGTVIATERAELGKMMSFSQNPPERLLCHQLAGLGDEAYDRLTRDVEESFAAVILGRNTVASFGRLWLKQGVDNLPRLASLPTIAEIGDRFAGIPMVIVAPGPSLEKNIDLLAELEGRAIIATFSHTLSAIAAAGIRPNVVVAVDMEDLRYHFDDYPIGDIDALALGVTVHPDLFELPARTTFSLASNSRLDDWLCHPLGGDMTVDSGGSVAHTAFSLGRRWGCNPIVLVGQDLSFPGGKVYCGSNVDGETIAELSEDGERVLLSGWSDGYANLGSIGGRKQGYAEEVVKVPGWSGGEVISSSAFALFRRWFIDTADDVRAKEEALTLLNCTEGGAFIDGWEHTTLREAIDTRLGSLSKVPIGERFANAAQTCDRERKTRVVSRLREIGRALARTRRAAKTCVSLTNKIIGGRKNLIGRLGAAEKKLRRAIEPVAFVALAAQAEINRGCNAARTEKVLSDNLRASLRLFESIHEICADFGPRIATSIGQLQPNELEAK